MTGAHSNIITTDQLADRLGESGLIVLDASKHLPAAKRDPLAEFQAAHIPGARFMGLASLTDTESEVPQALPSPQRLAERLAELGVSAGDFVVLYDDSAIKSAARAWFMLVAHGFEGVAVLDGGLAKWRGEGRLMESGLPDIAPADPIELNPPTKVRSKADMLANLDSKAEQVLDARAADRVFGSGTDPVHGGENGRIPGSHNLPFGQVLRDDGTYKSPQDIRAALKDAGIALDRPIVTSCGSGMTASVLLFAAHLAGTDNTALYDGSWAEWAADPDMPKLQGPA